MKPLPPSKEAPVIRTHFADDVAWQSICKAIRKRRGWFQAHVDFVNDPDYDGLTAEQLTGLVPQDYEHSVAFLVDQTALSHPENPILVVDLFDKPGETFRVIPSEMWGVENNLSLANMSFCEFAENADADGVFRGF